MIEWNKRCRRSETRYSNRRTWKTKCGNYQVVEVDIKLGRSRDKYGNFLGYPVYYIALAIRRGDWHPLSEHRRLSAAKKQCEYYDTYECIKPRRTKAAKAIQRGKAKRKEKREQDES